MLQRNYFFEFAGMPQSGKSSVLEIVLHFLKRQGLSVGEYDGGSKSSPLYLADIEDLNFHLACKVAAFVITHASTATAPYNIFLLNRGLIDRCIFTDTLHRQHLLVRTRYESISGFLTSPRLIESMDGIFIFTTTPELALKRENENKLVHSGGQVMNMDFLSAMRLATEDGYRTAQEHLSNVLRIDTERRDRQLRETAEMVVNNILKIVNVPSY